MFRHDLDVIDNLRRDAVNTRDAHPSGIKKLQAYAAQLAWMSGKFPIDVLSRPSRLGALPFVAPWPAIADLPLLARLESISRGIPPSGTAPNTPSSRTTSNSSS